MGCSLCSGTYMNCLLTPKPHSYKPEDLIWIKCHQKESLWPHWKGPHKVILTTSDVSNEMESNSGCTSPTWSQSQTDDPTRTNTKDGLYDSIHRSWDSTLPDFPILLDGTDSANNLPMPAPMWWVLFHTMDRTMIANVTTNGSPTFHMDLCALLGWKAPPSLRKLMGMCMGITIIAVGTVCWRPTWLNIHSMPAQQENQILGERIIITPPGDSRHMCHGYRKKIGRNTFSLAGWWGHQSGWQAGKLNLIQMTVYNGLSTAWAAGKTWGLWRHGTGKTVGYFFLFRNFPHRWNDSQNPSALNEYWTLFRMRVRF